MNRRPLRASLAALATVGIVGSAGTAHALLCDRFAPIGLVDTQAALLSATNILEGKTAAACEVTLKVLDDEGLVIAMSTANVQPGVTASLGFTNDGPRKIVRAEVEPSGKKPCNLKKAILASFEVFDETTGKAELVLAPYIAPR